MYIKIVGDTTKYQGTLENMGNHLIKVSGLIQHTSGFQLFLDNDVLVGDYSNYIYPYDDPNLGEGVYEYSDNNMSYAEIEAPVKEEQEIQKIESVIAKTVGEDVTRLKERIAELTDIVTSLYETILELQEVSNSQDEDKNIDENEEVQGEKDKEE